MRNLLTRCTAPCTKPGTGCMQKVAELLRGKKPARFGEPLGEEAVSLGIHESQSRMWRALSEDQDRSGYGGCHVRRNCWAKLSRV